LVSKLTFYLFKLLHGRYSSIYKKCHPLYISHVEWNRHCLEGVSRIWESFLLFLSSYLENLSQVVALLTLILGVLFSWQCVLPSSTSQSIFVFICCSIHVSFHLFFTWPNETLFHGFYDLCKFLLWRIWSTSSTELF